MILPNLSDHLTTVDNCLSVDKSKMVDFSKKWWISTKKWWISLFRCCKNAHKHWKMLKMLQISNAMSEMKKKGV